MEMPWAESVEQAAEAVVAVVGGTGDVSQRTVPV